MYLIRISVRLVSSDALSSSQLQQYQQAPLFPDYGGGQSSTFQQAQIAFPGPATGVTAPPPGLPSGLHQYPLVDLNSEAIVSNLLNIFFAAQADTLLPVHSSDKATPPSLCQTTELSCRLLFNHPFSLGTLPSSTRALHKAPSALLLIISGFL